MGFFEDIKPMFKKRDLIFLESLRESENVYSFHFDKADDLHWKPGQHGIFAITHKKIKKPTRPFSVASSPSENIIKISMEITSNPSEFKKAMLELKKGMKVSIRGPFGPLHLDHMSPSLFIAGGIGITPIRAILKDVESHRNNGTNTMKLLYLDSKGSYLYKDELQVIASSTPLEIQFLKAREELYLGIDEFVKQYKNSGKYFVAGPKSLVDSATSYLKQNGISKHCIKKDVFFGYK